jgi:protein-S-isoprenylcysteine O-methyltransferase Ste14
MGRERFAKIYEFKPMREYFRPPFIPPFWLVGAVLAMLALDHIESAARVIPQDLSWVGWFLIGGGLTVAIYVDLIFTRRGTAIMPFGEASVLVTDGPFRYSRNPIYCGMVAALIGFGLILGGPISLVVIPIFVLIIYICFIRAEEAILEAAFGTEYLAYKARVRRWI